MEIDTHVTGSAVVALAIVAHAWQSRIQAPPQVLSIIGWIINLLVMVALLACWIRG